MLQRGPNSQLLVDALPIAVAAHAWFDGASKDTLYRMARRGELRLTRIAGRTYVTRQEAERVQRKRARTTNHRDGADGSTRA